MFIALATPVTPRGTTAVQKRRYTEGAAMPPSSGTRGRIRLFTSRPTIFPSRILEMSGGRMTKAMTYERTATKRMDSRSISSGGAYADAPYLKESWGTRPSDAGRRDIKAGVSFSAGRTSAGRLMALCPSGRCHGRHDPPDRRRVGEGGPRGRHDGLAPGPGPRRGPGRAELPPRQGGLRGPQGLHRTARGVHQRPLPARGDGLRQPRSHGEFWAGVRKRARLDRLRGAPRSV